MPFYTSPAQALHLPDAERQLKALVKNLPRKQNGALPSRKHLTGAESVLQQVGNVNQWMPSKLDSAARRLNYRYYRSGTKPPGTLASDFKNLTRDEQKAALWWILVYALDHEMDQGYTTMFGWFSPAGDILSLLGKRKLDWTAQEAMWLWVFSAKAIVEGPWSESAFLHVSNLALAATQQALETTSEGEDVTQLRNYITQAIPTIEGPRSPIRSEKQRISFVSHLKTTVGVQDALSANVLPVSEDFSKLARQELAATYPNLNTVGKYIMLLHRFEGTGGRPKVSWAKELHTMLHTPDGNLDVESAKTLATVAAAICTAAANTTPQIIEMGEAPHIWRREVWYTTSSTLIIQGAVHALDQLIEYAKADPEVLADKPANSLTQALFNLVSTTAAPGSGGQPVDLNIAKAALFVLISREKLPKEFGACVQNLAILVKDRQLAALVSSIANKFNGVTDIYTGPSVPTFGLQLHYAAPGFVSSSFHQEFEPYTVDVHLDSSGAKATWAEDGKTLTSPPRATTPALRNRVTATTAATTSAAKTLEGQKKFLATLANTGESFPLSVWRTYLVGHPVTGIAANQLLWLANFKDGQTLLGLPQLQNDTWGLAVITESGRLTFTPLDDTVSLSVWHPQVHPRPQEHQQWRAWWMKNMFTQPFGQLTLPMQGLGVDVKTLKNHPFVLRNMYQFIDSSFWSDPHNAVWRSDTESSIFFKGFGDDWRLKLTVAPSGPNMVEVKSLTFEQKKQSKWSKVPHTQLPTGFLQVAVFEVSKLLAHSVVTKTWLYTDAQVAEWVGATDAHQRTLLAAIPSVHAIWENRASVLCHYINSHIACGLVSQRSDQIFFTDLDIELDALSLISAEILDGDPVLSLTAGPGDRSAATTLFKEDLGASFALVVAKHYAKQVRQVPRPVNNNLSVMLEKQLSF